MSKPTVEFTQEPSIKLSSTEEAEIHVTVTPNAVGACTVTLSLLMSNCTFQNDLPELTEVIEVETADAKIEHVFKAQMKSTEPGTFFTLLFCRAINSEEKRSFRKPIEVEIDCTLPFIEMPTEPIV
ncbi:MAG: hypothetical protein AAGH79_08425 [Bacteroidota bacterium]